MYVCCMLHVCLSTLFHQKPLQMCECVYTQTNCDSWEIVGLRIFLSLSLDRECAYYTLPHDNSLSEYQQSYDCV